MSDNRRDESGAPMEKPPVSESWTSCDTFAGWEPNALEGALAAAGLPLDGWEFGRTGGHRTSFRSVDQGLFVKISAPSGVDDLVYESQIAAWLTDTDLPIIGLARDVPERVVEGDWGAATFWPLVEAVPYNDVDMRWMGRSLAAFHHHEPAPGLRPWAPEHWSQHDIQVIRGLDGVAPETCDVLQAEADRILGRAREQTDTARLVFLHGDAHAGNVVRSAKGAQLFCDFELAQFGPAEWDLSLVPVRVRRLGMSKDRLDELLEGYGPYDAEMLDAMIELRELRMAGGTRYAQRPNFLSQVALRASTLGDSGHADWTANFVSVAWDGSAPAT